MTKEEAIKIINCYDIGFYDLSGEKIPADKLVEAFDMAIEALKQEPKTGEWIPVSERLPREDGQYLVYYEGTIIGSCIEIMWYSEPSMPNVDVSGKHFYRSDSEWGDIIYDEIIAWMPLPKPYRKDSE